MVVDQTPSLLKTSSAGGCAAGRTGGCTVGREVVPTTYVDLNGNTSSVFQFTAASNLVPRADRFAVMVLYRAAFQRADSIKSKTFPGMVNEDHFLSVNDLR